MVLHIFPKSQFTEEYIFFINNHFEKSAHCFILYTNTAFELPKYIYEYENVYDYDNKGLFWLYKKLRKAERIIIHNLGVLVPELALLYFDSSLVKKSMWLIWGADLYCFLNPRNSVADRIVERMRRRIIRGFPVIASLTDGDYELAVKWYGCKSRNIRLDYCEEKTIELMNRYLQEDRKNDGTTRILLGNSATRTNQHIDAFRMLEHLKNDDICIYVPLSYGDKGYAQEVINEGRRIFGEKLIPLTRYMSREEYYKVLYDIDVGIFNNNRQQGTGNIEALLYYGRKIYLRDDTSMWKEWVDKEGYVLHCVDRIEDENPKSLSEVTKYEKEKNRELIIRYFDVKKDIQNWKMAFTLEL